MKKVDEEFWLVHTQGSVEKVYFSPDLYNCGDIKDGVTLEIEGYGLFVIERDEIRHMAELLGFCEPVQNHTG